nr:hypothetical protein 7 [Candidatus Hydrogenedentota bacterium]
MVVNAPGSKMRFLVDGKEVCSDRMVRNKVLEICIRVEEGKHTLRVETTDGKLSAESEFTIGKETLWAYIRYAPVQQDNDETTPSSAKKGELLITISKRFPYGIA